jgi:phosphohistidine phosphatase
MMKTLYLLRHAKASRGDPALPDRERPLEPRGRQDAAAMSRQWPEHHARPERILASPALRTRETARIMADGLGCEADAIIIENRLYAATRDDLMAVIGGLDDRVDRVMLVGHNPGLTELSHHFDPDITDLPTCALAEFRFELACWADIGRARPVHSRLRTPKHPSH